MAAKKTKPKSAAPKAAVKPAEKASKSAAVAKKSSVKPSKTAKKTVAAKTKAPAKSGEKAVAKKPVVKKPEKPAVKKVEKPAPEAKTSKAAKAPKAKSTKPRSSLVDFPVPTAPVKPPFVPPKKTEGPVATGANGSHSAAFIKKQHQRLLDLRDDLVDAMSGMTRDTIRNAPEGSEASGSGQHQGDAGSDAYDRDFALSVLAKEQDALYEIEQALRRIKAGNYGICELSIRKIPQTRLEAIPFARLTVECQSQWEKEYGNRRFRPSNEVGFGGGNYGDDENSDSVSLDEDDD